MKRIQRRRTKGWRMPENCVYVGRPTKWGNPFPVGSAVNTKGCTHTIFVRDSATSVALFRLWVWANDLNRIQAVEELRGKDLACWCPLEDEYGNRVPCHADVLLELANQRVESTAIDTTKYGEGE